MPAPADLREGHRSRPAGIVEMGLLVTGEGDMALDVGGGSAVLAVRLTSTPPPHSREAVPVLLEGAWQGDASGTGEALIRHESGYEAPSTGNAPDG